MDISTTGLHLIESFEGYSFRAYWDSFGHVWTVGYGETSGVDRFSTQTRAQAEMDLQHRMVNQYEPAIKNLGVPLTQNQFDALCSFVWNVGPGSMQWDVGRYLRAREYSRAADALLEYDRAGGVVLAGLVRRREEERRVFLEAPPLPPDPHHYSRFPSVAFSFNHGWLHLNERLIVQEYDRLRVHGVRNRKALAPIRIHLRSLANRVWAVAHWHNPPNWDRLWLGWRYQNLIRRANGQRIGVDFKP